ncbi:MAG: glycoside hydrolase family 65 protein [Ktedonobacteraceae bacterium]
MNLWHITEDTFNPQMLHTKETVYTIGNGYFGTRGSFAEGYPGATAATLLYGIFDHIPIGKEELANAPDWTLLKLFVNGERFRLDQGKILAYERSLDIQHGMLSRVVRWESPGGIRLKVVSERFASLADEHVGVIHYSVTSEDTSEDVNVVLWASLNTAVGNYELMHWETVDQGNDGEIIWLHTQTLHSHVQLAQSMSFIADTPAFEHAVIDSDIAPSIRLHGKLAPGMTVTTEKIVVMYTSRDNETPVLSAVEHHKNLVHHTGNGYKVAAQEENSQTQKHMSQAYATLLTQHKQAWLEYWQPSDIIIEGDDKAQLAIRYNIYQLRISTSAHDDRYSIAAKGLTGFGYRGHIFHDTEIFMLPYFTYVHPSIARNLVLYRYHLLPGARKKAKQSGYKGAQYPWESTLDGDEATPGTIIHPESGEIIPVLNGSIELHITASIAHGAWQYWDISGDDDFMRDYGAEILLSTAQFWASRAEHDSKHNDYEINDVIGPDEWHEHVNNNAFTNYMARWNIQTALDVLDWLYETAPDKATELTQQLDVNKQDFEHWRDVVALMHIPQNKATRLIEQFDGFFNLEPLDQNAYKGRTASYQALLGMQRVQEHQIVKQADVLMLLTVLDDQFDLATKKVNWDYYYPITDHDYGSSLTPALHVILACELGQVATAYKQYILGALVDLENLRGNTPEGIHDACAGAVWQATILGFAGLRLTEDGYTTAPSWPDGWTRLAFTFMHKGQTIKVDLHKE